MTTPQQLTDELVGLIRSEIAIADVDIDADTDLLLTGAVDSLGVVTIVDWLEERLDIDIDPGDVVLEHFISVSAMVSFLGSRAAVGTS